MPKNLADKVKAFLALAPDNQLSRSELVRKTHATANQLTAAVNQLALQGEVAAEQIATRGAPTTVYKLLTKPDFDPRLVALGRLFEQAVKLVMEGRAA